MSEPPAPTAFTTPLEQARRQLAEPAARERVYAPLAAAALAAAGGLGAAWIVIFGPNFPDPASSAPVRAAIGAPAVDSASVAGAS